MNRNFQVRWKATGEVFDAWPNTSGFGFSKPDEVPFRSLPAEQFWQVFEKVEKEKPAPKGNMGLFSGE